MLRYEERVGPVGFAVTDRRGGSSPEPYAGLNLGGHVGDDRAAVLANRAEVAARIGLPPQRVLYMNQVHGAEVATVSGPWGADPPAVDAMITSEPGLGLAVLVADCVPVLLADPEAGLIGVAHAGRPGMVAGVVPAVVSAMRERGAHAITARIGPAVCGGCYEVPPFMRDEVAAAVPAARAETRWGTPAVDVPAGVAEQLAVAGVTTARIDHCTVEEPDLYSYRRDRTTGRFAGLVWLEPA